MAKNWSAVITIGLRNRAQAGLQAIGGQVRDLSRGMTGSLGGAGRAMDGLGSIASALVPGLGAPFMAANVAAKGLMLGLQAVGNVAKGAFNVVVSGARSAANVLKWAGLAAAGLTAAVAKSSLDAAMEMENFSTRMLVAFNDPGLAKSMLGWAKNFADATPFETGETIDATVRLKLYGLEAKKWLPLVGDMAGAMGKKVTDGVEAVADAISGGGLERLKEFGINSVRLLANGAMKSPTGEGVYYGTAKAIDALKGAIEKIIKTDFGGGMAKMAQTATGKLSTFRGALWSLRVMIGQAMMPAFDGLLQKGNAIVAWLQNSGAAGRIGEGLGAAFQRMAELAVPAINWLLGMLTPKSMASIGAWFSGLAKSLSSGANWIQYLARYVSANIPVIGAWLKYLGEYARYLAAQFYRHLPDIAEVAVKVFYGLAQTFSVAEVAWIGLKTGFLVVADAIGLAFLVVGGIVTGVLALIAKSTLITLRALNMISGGALDGWVKSLEGVDTGLTNAASAMLSAQPDMLKKMSTDAWQGRNESVAARERGGRLAGDEATALQWISGMRTNHFAGPEPVAPQAPGQQFVPWAQTKGQPAMRSAIDVNVTVTGADQQSLDAILQSKIFEQQLQRKIRRMVPATGLQ